MMSDVYKPEELLESIDAAAVADDLKMALRDFVPTLAPLLPHLSSRSQLLTAYYFKFLVEEVTAVAVATHWWEMHLDLISQAAHSHETGRPLLAAAAQAAPLIRAHFGPHGAVALQLITDETVRGICRLSETLTDPQDLFVAPNAYSLAQAHFHPHAWFRAVYAGKTPVGFIMLAADEEKQEYFLWRYMIATPYQGYGYGRDAIDLLVEYVRTRPGAKELLVSCVPHPQGPYPFYLKCGFVDTGDIEDGEVVMKLIL